MNITIDLTQLNIDELNELSSILSNSIDYSIETNEMENNYEALQEIDEFINSK